MRMTQTPAHRTQSVTISAPVLPQYREHVVVPHLLRPRLRGRPRLGAGLPWFRAALQQQFDQAGATPAARPAEWRALEQIVADVQPGTRVQEHSRKGDYLLVGYVPAHRRHLVQARLAESLGADIGVAALQHQPEAGEVC